MWKASRYFLIIAAVLAFANVIPYLYNIALGGRVSSPYYQYSPVLNDFVYYSTDRSARAEYMDTTGRQYSKDEYIKLLPMLYARDLFSRGEYPADIGGVSIPVERALREKDFRMIRPAFIDKEYTRMQIYPLFESASGFTGVELPVDLFRITDRVEFYNAERNSVDSAKSELYTDALAAAGFQFPAVKIFGNTDTRKPFDWGYFVVDSAGSVYNLRQVKGQPWVADTGIGASQPVLAVMVSENQYLDYYGLMITTDGTVYKVLLDGYRTERVGAYDPYNESLYYYMNPITTELSISGVGYEDMYILSTATHQPIAEKHNIEGTRLNGFAKTVYEAAFPFVLRADNNKSGRDLSFYLSENFMAAVICSVILAAVYGAVRFGSGRRYRLATDTALVLVGGVYALLALLLLNDTKGKDKWI